MRKAYTNSTGYLNDCFAFIDLLREHASQKRRTDEAGGRTRAALLAMYGDIRMKACVSLQKGANIPLEKLSQKDKLDDIEVLILWVCVYAAVCGDDDLNRVSGIRKFIPLMSGVDPIAAMKYWNKDARLIQKKLVTPAFGGRGLTGGSIQSLFIEPAALNHLLGKKTRKTSPASEKWSPKVLYQKLSEFVVGQDRAKKALATAVFKHLQIARLNKKRKGFDRLQKANILLIGPTGTGKTHLCRTLAKILDVPFAICDATQYTETGYVGASVEEMLVSLYKAADSDSKRMENGIIYIDEIDKIAARDCGSGHRTGKDVSGLCVQEELLKLLEGEVIRYTDHCHNQEFNVSNILFIAGGAFAGMEDIIKTRLKSRQIGFCTSLTQPEDAAGCLLGLTSTEDFISFGFAPEFIGRFASLAALDPLSKDDLISIMTQPKNNLLSQYRALFGASGMDLRVPQTALDWVAQRAMDNHTGARGLKAILEKGLAPLLFENGGSAQAADGAPLKEVVFEPEPDDAPDLREA